MSIYPEWIGEAAPDPEPWEDIAAVVAAGLDASVRVYVPPIANLSDVTAGMVALLEAAVPRDTVVLVGLEPADVDVERFPSFALLISRQIEYEESMTIAATTQWAVWTWDVYFRHGHAGTGSDAIDELDTLTSASFLGLQGEEPTGLCGPLEISVMSDFVGWLEGSPVIRQEWKHRTRPGGDN